LVYTAVIYSTTVCNVVRLDATEEPIGNNMENIMDSFKSPSRNYARDFERNKTKVR